MHAMRNVALIVAAGLLAAGTAAGDLDTSNVYTDQNNVTWTGTVLLDGALVPMIGDPNLKANVEYVVNDRVPHAGELQFEYVYQVTSAGSTDIAQFAVEMLDSNEAMDIGSFDTTTPAGQIAPTSAAFEGSHPSGDPTTANWYFDALNDIGDVSYGLNFWSVNAPTTGGCAIYDHAFAMATIATPSNEIPEPLTLGLLSVGGLALLRRR
jgi:hypothetical protein